MDTAELLDRAVGTNVQLDLNVALAAVGPIGATPRFALFEWFALF